MKLNQTTPGLNWESAVAIVRNCWRLPHQIFRKLDSRNEDARVMWNNVRLVPEVQQIDLTIVRRGLQERHQDCIHNASQLCR